MVVIGIVLVIVGVAIVMPSGAAPGSAAHRIVRINSMNTDVTPGYQHDRPPATWRGTLRRIAIGLALIALGLWCMSLGWPDGV